MQIKKSGGFEKNDYIEKFRKGTRKGSFFDIILYLRI